MDITPRAGHLTTHRISLLHASYKLKSSLKTASPILFELSSQGGLPSFILGSDSS